MSNLEGDKDFTIDVNLAGVTAADGTGFKLPEGYYMAQVTDAAVQDSKQGNGNKNLVVDVKVTGPTHIGISRRRWLPLRADALYFFKGFLASCGFATAALEKTVSVNPKSVIGRNCFIHVIPAAAAGNTPVGTTDANAKQYDDVQFVTETVYKQNASNGSTRSTFATPTEVTGGLS